MSTTNDAEEAIFMMMCKDATRLMSKRLDTTLTLRERMALSLHLAMCSACSECNRQFTLLQRSGERFVPLEDHDGADMPSRRP